MEAFGPASESLRISEHYRRLTDDELIAVAQDKSDLTDLAQQALAAELSQRKLTVPPQEAPSPLPEPTYEEDAEDPYADERQLVQIATVWSLPDALKLQDLLDQAGIPFFMGKERATRAEAVTSNFRDGVSVGVMQIGMAWAQQALQHYEPADEPTTQDQQSGEDLAVHCPRCHSEDVVFERLADSANSNESQRFDWTCASCGYRWEDDGVETKN
jgi:DNA-directed RNA polymerase subunit M/transcription elongation factor TFIIS